ncbi:NADPH-dependent FMN reductase [Chitiniphilus purpureus]|uniref:NADPH-dependent FMN reductase n=1 Tax=Chitiniphilus purpureus TaxID=2981137 RepID=A0ABY6DPY0_9NEIS|nr:NADPH-dependent FMN reductase [Chitiniphilus sp. CD1]UXY16082.1 NADPH-dependent FMN reductase [Chitiniphilus sp. CD1]
MSTVVLLAGSPSQRSRSTTLLQRAGALLASHGARTQAFSLTDFPSDDLLHARWDSPAIRRFIEALAAADGLIVATPVYKAAYSGALKAVLDLLPERALEQKAALALATGGSPGHLLAVDYALQPVLSALKARHIVGGVYATDRDFTLQDDGSYQVGEDIDARLHHAVGRLIAHLPDPGSVQLHPEELPRQVAAARISI